MQTGKQIKLDITVNNPNLPILFKDKRMNRGTIALLDYSHPVYEGYRNIPGNGEFIKNIAWENAQKIINTGLVENDFSFPVENTLLSNGLKMEFTSKKGLHGIVSQVNDIANGNDFIIKIPVAIRDYIFNNISRGFFISLWTRKTRLALTSTSANFVLNLNSTSNYVCSFQTGGSTILGGNMGYRGDSTQLNSLSNQCLNLGVNQKTGSPSIIESSGFKFGSQWAYAGFEVNKTCSEILYQIHIVDLTSAGLTYSQADSLDYAYFQEAFGPGGRFYNDTFTSPSTFL